MNTASNPKRRAILDAARKTFLTHGYSGARMDTIAEAAPVSKPTLYTHFESKQALFAAVIADQCDDLLRTLDQAQDHTQDPVAALTDIARAFVDVLYSPEAIGLYRLLMSAQQQCPELGELAYHSSAAPVQNLLSAYLGELAAQGFLQIEDVELSSRLLLGMLKGDHHFRCLLGLQTGLAPAEKKQLIDAAVGLFLKGHGHAR